MEIPTIIKKIIKKLTESGYEAYIVGGCVRDYLRDVEPTDWDITTSAKPAEIQKLFPESAKYDNKFGTVTVTEVEGEKSDVGEIEITTYRAEEAYSDKRHPDKVKFVDNIKDDLARRDFTINAMAMEVQSKKDEVRSKKDEGRSEKKESSDFRIIDPFGGEKDLEEKLIRTVGEPKERFQEDALRLMRAVRFASTLNFTIEQETVEAIKEQAPTIKEIAFERVHDELVKMLMHKRAHFGIMYLSETGLLKHIIPELEQGLGVTQNFHHIYDCFYHGAYSLRYAAKYGYNLNVRLAALLHDIGKPPTKEHLGYHAHFYNHAQVGADMTEKALRRLKFPKKRIEKIKILVKEHLFYYDVDQVTESGVRRLLRRVGKKNIKELLQVRISERKGSGVPKAQPYRLRHLKYMLEKVAADPISPEMLEIDGNDIMEILGIEPGPKVGLYLEALLQEVLDEPKKNNSDYLKKRLQELEKLSHRQLKEKAKEVDKKRKRRDKEMKEKHYVK